MDAARQAREERKEELLRELAEINVAEQVEAGVFLGTPHFCIIERAAAHLGRQLSRQAQERAAREVAADCATQVPCPGCQTLCDVQTENRFITSADGPVEVTEAVADCEKCRRSFFPQREAMGLDSREVTPELTRMVIHLVAEVRSFERAEITIEKVLGQKVSRSSVRRLTSQVGRELADLDPDDMPTGNQEVIVPEVAVVSCDGGRIRTRQPDGGRGVRLSGEKGWRETKNASLERMTVAENHSSHEDPCPALPTSFRSAAKVANISEKPVPNVDQPASDEKGRVIYKGPRRVLRTAVSSMACSDEFGPMMHREAQRRLFFKAILQAFIGDGLNWNWSIWKTHFPTFIPILDFIHVIHYIFAAAMCLGPKETEGWETYMKFITLCWEGRVGEVIEILTDACHERDVDLETRLADDDPNKPLADAVRYLSNNRTRMDYPRYRRLGLPVTSSPMESLIKQINYRVKGTEMFWDDPHGAEAILHVRAAALSEDGRLDRYLDKRPGWPFVRRSTKISTAA